jgi:ferric-dicitrate binding protein FerR (iron transport regulator)
VALAASLALMIATRGPFGVRAVAEPTTVVEAMTGTVWVRGTETAVSRFLRVGDAVPLGSGLRSAKGGRAAIRLASGHSLRLDNSTEIRMLDGGRIAFDSGTIYVDSGADSTTVDALAVTTAIGEIREVGTQFEVRLKDDGLRLRLREGAVDLRRDGEVVQVAEGVELTIDSDGTATRRVIAGYGSEWEWLVDVTPMLEIKGLSARTFLDWVARERGWSLTFTDETLARHAEQIVLEGTLQGLTIDQALDAVLPTCQMVHRVESGLLEISRRDTEP